MNKIDNKLKQTQGPAHASLCYRHRHAATATDHAEEIKVVNPSPVESPDFIPTRAAQSSQHCLSHWCRTVGSGVKDSEL
ncbi:hypothetical protein INR49_017007 [Caranx melampygus]|nr:hypothetical protein INR49_017007 [Caranx melampygus]